MSQRMEADPLEDLMWEVSLAVRREMIGYSGNSSLVLLGPELVGAEEEYGMRVPDPYRRRRY